MLLHVVRALCSVIADGICLIAVLVAGRLTHHAAMIGGPMLVLGIGYAASALAAKMSWLVAAALGSVGLLTLNHAPAAMVDYVPSGVGIAAFAVGFAIYAVSGPRGPLSG